MEEEQNNNDDNTQPHCGGDIEYIAPNGKRFVISTDREAVCGCGNQVNDKRL